MSVPEISVRDTRARLDGPTPPRLIDVREPGEWEYSRIAGSELLPLSQWPAIAVKKLTDKTEPLLIHCHHGGRSARAAAWLIQQGYGSVMNVAGGLDAWSREIDPSVPRYE